MDDEDCYFDSDLLELTGNKVFPDHYIEKFNSLCQRYGKFLSRQSDRNLPRTNFFTDYTRITRKNGHEMAGLLIVYIMVMTSFEGEYLDQTLGQEQ
jgi:hypothetical protein